MNDIKANGVEIYSTKDYDRFSFIKGNRIVNEGRVKKIILSVKEKINLLPYNPIIVDKNYRIVDGQHRFTVSKLMNKPVFYVILESNGLKSISTINSNTKNWTLHEFCDWYARRNNKHYKDLGSLQQKAKISINYCIGLLWSGTPNVHAIHLEKFRNGEFVINHGIYAPSFISHINEIREFHENESINRNLLVAFKDIYDGDAYDHKRMLIKLKQLGGMQKQGSVKQYLAKFEEIFNHKLRERIHLY